MRFVKLTMAILTAAFLTIVASRSYELGESRFAEPLQDQAARLIRGGDPGYSQKKDMYCDEFAASQLGVVAARDCSSVQNGTPCVYCAEENQQGAKLEGTMVTPGYIESVFYVFCSLKYEGLCFAGVCDVEPANNNCPNVNKPEMQTGPGGG